MKSKIYSQIEEVQKEIKKQEQHIQAKPLIVQIEQFERRLTALKQQKETIIEAKQTQKEIDIAIKTKKVLVRKYIKKIKENKSCPTCFGPITNKIIRRIEKEMKI